MIYKDCLIYGRKQKMGLSDSQLDSLVQHCEKYIDVWKNNTTCDNHLQQLGAAIAAESILFLIDQMKHNGEST